MIPKKHPWKFALLAGLALSQSGCADDNLSKGLVTVAGAGAGAFIGSKLAGPQNQMMGAVLGAAAGGGLGYMLGGQIGRR